MYIISNFPISTDIDECEFNECVHGTCQNKIGFYTCDCETGYEGELCQTPTDECDPTPCLHEAGCTDKFNDFRYVFSI